MPVGAGKGQEAREGVGIQVRAAEPKSMDSEAHSSEGLISKSPCRQDFWDDMYEVLTASLKLLKARLGGEPQEDICTAVRTAV